MSVFAPRQALLGAIGILAIACNNSWSSKGSDPDAVGDDGGDADTGITDVPDDTGTDTIDPGDQDNDGDGFTPNGGDCDDTDPSIHPDAPEFCDGFDNDCDGEIDEGSGPTWYEDADGDGFGDPGTGLDACDQPDGSVDNGEDCDDTEVEVNPDATEICDGIDNNCDGHSDADDDLDEDGTQDCNDWCPIMVDIYAPTGGDGSHARPFNLIQDGIDTSVPTGCYEVWVEEGTYYENIDFIGYPIRVLGLRGPEITIIDGQAAGSVASFVTAEARDSILQGFTLRNGASDRGAGIHINESSPTITGNIITQNATNADLHIGGGIISFNGSPLIEDNLIEANDAGYGGPENGCDGGGIMARGGAPEIVGNTILDNTAGDGGGIWLARSDALITNNIIDGNTAHDSDAVQAGQGGGINIQISTSSTFVLNNIVTSNTASTHGGGITVYEWSATTGEPTIANNVIAFNDVSSSSYGDGLLVWQYTRPIVYNNAIYGNGEVGVWLNNYGVVYTYNNVHGSTAAYAGDQGNPTGSNGNIAMDPGFTAASDDDDYTNDDFRLGSSSGLVNAGDPAVSDPDSSRSDIGAYGGLWGAW